VAGNPCRGRSLKHQKNGNLYFSDSSEDEDHCVHRAAYMYIKPVSECKMVLKYSFKPFFLKCIFEFMINTAPQGSNSVNGREKYFNCINFKKQTVQ